MGFFSKLFGGSASSGADFYSTLLQLAPGETMASCGFGRYLVGYGKFANNQVTFGESFMIATTSAGRLVFGDMQTNKPERARPFTPGTLRLEDRGFLDEIEGGIFARRKELTVVGSTGAMERVRVILCTPQQGEPFAIYLTQSDVPKFLGWGAS